MVSWQARDLHLPRDLDPLLRQELVLELEHQDDEHEEEAPRREIDRDVRVLPHHPRATERGEDDAQEEHQPAPGRQLEEEALEDAWDQEERAAEPPHGFEARSLLVVEVETVDRPQVPAERAVEVPVDAGLADVLEDDLAEARLDRHGGRGYTRPPIAIDGRDLDQRGVSALREARLVVAVLPLAR